MLQAVLTSTASNVTRFFVMAALTLVMTPIYVHTLGNHDYGVWEIIASIVGYLGLLDLGLRPSVTRFAARVTAPFQLEQRRLLFSTAMALLGGIGALLALGLLLVAMYAPPFLFDTAGDATRQQWLFLIVALQIGLAFPTFVCESFLEGFQRYLYKNLVAMSLAIAMAASFVLLRHEHDPLLLLAALAAIKTAVQLVLFYLPLRLAETFGRLVPLRPAPSPAQAGELLRFGMKSFVQGAAQVVETRTGVLIIGAMLSPAMIVFYALPIALARHIYGLGQNLTHAFMPAFATLAAQGNMTQARRYFLEGSRFTVALIAPMLIAGYIVGPDFIGAWIGPEYGERSRIVLYMALGYFGLPLLIPFGSRMLVALNRHGFLARLSVVLAASHAALSFALVIPAGIEGVAMAGLITSSLYLPLTLTYTCRVLSIPVREYVRRALLPSAAPSAVLLIALLAFQAGFPTSSLINLLAALAVGAACYVLVAWKGLYQDSLALRQP